MSMHARLRRLEALERQSPPNAGLLVFLCLARIGELADRRVDVVAITTTEGRLDRLPGEGLTALHTRANPTGTWKLHPRPVFGEIA